MKKQYYDNLFKNCNLNKYIYSIQFNSMEAIIKNIYKVSGIGIILICDSISGIIKPGESYKMNDLKIDDKIIPDI